LEEVKKILPNYVLQVEEMLKEGNVPDAIELCQEGIEAYPTYIVGFLLLAEAYELSNDADSVAIILNGAKEIFANNKTLKMYYNRFKQTGELGYIFPKSKLPKSNDFFQKVSESIHVTGFVKPAVSEILEEPEDLTEQNPEIPPTEFMAELLVRQEKFVEAVETYEKLKLVNPEKYDYFQSKINEIKSR